MSNHIQDNFVMEYLEKLLREDRRRLLRIMAWIKERIYEEEAKCQADEAIRKAQK